jgi:hypothetical protein
MYEKPMETPHIELPLGHPHLDGLQAWHLFNEQGNKVFDWTGNGNDLSVVDADWYGDGLRFDANEEYALLDNTDQIINSEVGTMVIRYKSLSSIYDGENRSLFGFRGAANDNGDFWVVKSTGSDVYFIITDNVGPHYIYAVDTFFPNWENGFQLTLQWDRSNAIYTSQKLAINVDGNYVLTGYVNATAWNTFTVASNLAIGNDYDDILVENPTSHCNGIISDFRIYNKILNTDMIKDICENRYEPLSAWL